MKFANLRRWQQRFATNFDGSNVQTFLLVALPGAGKTNAALYVAREWLQGRGDRPRLLMVAVPSTHLKTQWRKRAKDAFGLELQTKEVDGAPKSGMHGIVVTYQAIASMPGLFERLCHRYEVFVIFDEMHHVGDAATWGEAVRRAFEPAVKRLAMSGTPWRSDGGSIPFLTRLPDDSGYEIHERFDWPAALEEEPPPIRHLSFRPYHGYCEYKRDGQMFRLSSQDTLTDEQWARCLRGLVMEARFVKDMVREAHEKLLELRQTKPDAGGLIVCIDQDHAARVAQWVEEVTGEQPVVVVSDDDIATGETIEDFANSRRPWLVSVRKVSEGVDIPRLIVGVFAATWTTELFFRQVIGRVARHQGTSADAEGYVYFPFHKQLTEYARRIQELQAVAIQRKLDAAEHEDAAGGGHREGRTIYLGGSQAESAGLILPGVVGDPVLDRQMERRIVTVAKRYGIPETVAARMVQDHPTILSSLGESDPNVPPSSEPPLEERLEELRRRNHKRANWLIHLTGAQHNVVNADLNRAVGCKSVDTATEEQLKQRLALIMKRIAAARTQQG